MPDRDDTGFTWRQLAWFVGLWCAGVLAVSTVGLVIRVWLS